MFTSKMKKIIIGLLILGIISIIGCSKNIENVSLSDGHSNTLEHLAEHDLAEEIQKRTNTEPIPDNARMLTLKIDGMTCPSCSLGEAVIYEELDGVFEAKIIYKEGLGKVIYDPAKITPEKIITFSTYSTSILKDENFEQKVHIHADFKVYINDNIIDFSQPMYQLRDKYIHVEDNIGDVVHVHKADVTISDFFETLDIKFNNKCITIPIEGSFCNDDNLQLRFFVNNEENSEFEKYEMKNFDKILISYGEGDLTKQLDSITDFALKAK